jgi:hypothetical protein
MLVVPSAGRLVYVIAPVPLSVQVSVATSLTFCLPVDPLPALRSCSVALCSVLPAYAERSNLKYVASTGLLSTPNTVPVPKFVPEAPLDT